MFIVMSKIKQHWVKTTPYGDYCLTTDRVNSRNTRNVHIVREAKRLMLVGKHAGYKPIKRLINHIRKLEMLSRAA